MTNVKIIILLTYKTFDLIKSIDYLMWFHCENFDLQLSKQNLD